MRIAALVLLALLLAPDLASAERGMTWTDLMQVRKVYDRTLSDDGRWFAFEARPGRGDGEVIVRATRGGDEHRIARGQAPALSSNGEWAAAKVLATFEARETADEAPKSGAALLRLDDGETWEFERVKSFAFSDDGEWFALHFEEDEPDSTEAGAEAEADAKSSAPEAEGEDADGEDEPEPRDAGTGVTVVRLSDQKTFEIENVASMAFDPTSNWLALVIATEDGADDRLELRALTGDLPATVVHAAAMHTYPAMAWAEETTRLAYLRGDATDPEDVGPLTLDVLSPRGDADLGPITTIEATEGWRFPEKNDLEFTRDGARLFVGQRPATDDEDDAEDEDAAFDPYDIESILADREVDVWHWDDPRIKTNEKSTYGDRQEHQYRAVVDVAAGRLVPLADERVPDVRVSQNPYFTHGSSSEPHLKLMTWDGFYSDHYVVDLETGERTLVVDKTRHAVSMSPQGGFLAYYRPGEGGQWWLYEAATGQARRLRPTDLNVKWENEDHDYPQTAPGYGVGGWATDDSAVLIYDKYDVWMFPTSTGPAVCLTEGVGREEERIFRVLDLDDEKEGFDPDEALLLTGYHDKRKNSAIYRGSMAQAGVEKLREDQKHYLRFERADDADVIVYSEESYTEFPDYWVTDGDFRRPKKITEVNPQLDDLDLGTAELVEWQSMDGTPLQGILIKPAGYREGDRVPVLVYYYRFFTQRLHRFNDPEINHRPSFPIYAGDGYAVFLPDIRFDVGNPGYAATKCLVPGIQKIIEMGVADPDGIALHGHSWSGYQTAHVITQTDAFACAVAGAPVSNMTIAYGGIRYGTGLSRQFQYEKSQSRLGASMWERRDLYIENSPVFFADRIETPLLIQFGDEDEAVPWTQGIELYMAMRRLGKPAVMLQYRGEPHHLKKYANKLDYSIKMKEFIDHFTKGAPAPAWWTEGVEYTEDDE